MDIAKFHQLITVLAICLKLLEECNLNVLICLQLNFHNRTKVYNTFVKFQLPDCCLIATSASIGDMDILQTCADLVQVNNLKLEQKECLEGVLKNKDVLAVLPTGYGKSLIYQLAPYALTLRDNINLSNISYMVLVLTPLNSIMIDQCSALSKLGIKACALDYQCVQGSTFLYQEEDHDEAEDDEDSEGADLTSSVDLDDILMGKYQVVYAHPEAIISTRRGRQMLQDDRLKKNPVCIAVDEAHMVLEWFVAFFYSFGMVCLVGGLQ